MRVSAKDKRIKVAMASPRGTVIKGLQPGEADRIRVRVDVMIASPTLKSVAENHPEWRVHRWKGKVQWSIDVLANTRLLFDYDPKSHDCSGLAYDDPH